MILDDIVKSVLLRLEEQKRNKTLDELKSEVSKCRCGGSVRFENALRNQDIAFICEVKKASPSKGVIAQDFPYKDIARDYEEAGASAISVLTERDFFKGSPDYLKEIAACVKIPVLRKDFIIDEYQIYESVLLKASAILLICAILDAEKLKKYITLADSLGLSSLVEVHDESEIKMALDADARIIGVNNRNLKTFQVDINNSIKLRPFVPENIVFVSESGIKTVEDIKKLREIGANAVLIGETFMRSADKKKVFACLRGQGYEN